MICLVRALNRRGGLDREVAMRVPRTVLAPLLLAVALVFGVSTASPAYVGIAVSVAPPPLPVYAQPPIPGPGYIWTPGYWAWGSHGYYWVPGTWVLPPAAGLLWTPGYWGSGVGRFVFHAGYWGPRVGFYGGINYGFGYFGAGYVGGYWRHGGFYYNRAVNNFGNTRITRVYNRTVVVNRTTNISYNGGRGGITARPTPAERAAAHERRVAATAAQRRQERAAAADRSLRASTNHGHPPISATRRAGEFSEHHVVAARRAASSSAHERAVQRRAAHERAVHQRAAHERAVHQRAAHERAVHQRAAHRDQQQARR
jgi:WXXGXW repeat (2 copies)